MFPTFTRNVFSHLVALGSHQRDTTPLHFGNGATPRPTLPTRYRMQALPRESAPEEQDKGRRPMASVPPRPQCVGPIRGTFAARFFTKSSINLRFYKDSATTAGSSYLSCFVRDSTVLCAAVHADSAEHCEASHIHI